MPLLGIGPAWGIMFLAAFASLLVQSHVSENMNRNKRKNSKLPHDLCCALTQLFGILEAWPEGLGSTWRQDLTEQ